LVRGEGEGLVGERGGFHGDALEALGHGEALAVGVFGVCAGEEEVVAGGGGIVGRTGCDGSEVVEGAADVMLIGLRTVDREDVEGVSTDAARDAQESYRRVAVSDSAGGRGEEIAAGLPGVVIHGELRVDGRCAREKNSESRKATQGGRKVNQLRSPDDEDGCALEVMMPRNWKRCHTPFRAGVV